MTRIVYHLLKYHIPYEEIGAEGYQSQQRERDEAALRKKAAKLGFTVTARESSPATA
jgi:hypothetical protein